MVRRVVCGKALVCHLIDCLADRLLEIDELSSGKASKRCYADDRGHAPELRQDLFNVRRPHPQPAMCARSL
jgi:hypothetical protein